jgi:hypothetical protein
MAGAMRLALKIMNKLAVSCIDRVPLITIDEIKNEMMLEARCHSSQIGLDGQLIPVNHYSLPNAPSDLLNLLTLNGSAFVEAAYYSILNRGPNQADATYFASEIAAGTSKVLMLGWLQHSPEGRLAARPLKGLMRRYYVHRLYRVPVLGLGVRVVSAALRRAGVSRAIGSRIVLKMKRAPLYRLDAR